MNTNELQQILRQAQKLGLSTFGELVNLSEIKGWKTNNEIINGINELYCEPNNSDLLTLINEAHQITTEAYLLGAPKIAEAISKVRQVWQYCDKNKHPQEPAALDTLCELVRILDTFNTLLRK